MYNNAGIGMKRVQRRVNGLIIKKICITLFLLLLTGCGEAKAMGEPEDIVQVSISYAGMSRDSNYGYTLKDINGAVYFSGHYIIAEKDINKIVYKDVLVKSEYMDQLREIVKEHGFTNLRPKKPGIFPLPIKALYTKISRRTN